MNALRAILVDDEADAIMLLATMLGEEFPGIEIAGRAQSVAAGIELIQRCEPDLVFLDIMMADGDGFQLLERVDRSALQVIFTTAYDCYAAKAFEYAAIHYLVKPIDPEALHDAVSRARQRRPGHLLSDVQMKAVSESLNSQVAKLALPNKTGFDLVAIDDITRCEACDSYTRFYLRDQRALLITKPINKYEALLADRHFFRVHRKHLVNLAFVSSYVKGKPGYLVMQDGASVEVSVRRKDELRLELEQLIRF